MTDLMEEPVFILEGPMGSAELYRTEYGFWLYFEDTEHGYKPEKIGEYELSQVGAVAIAFTDAKQFVGLEGWDKNWREFYEENVSNGERTE